MLRLSNNLKSTQWQVLAGLVLILSMLLVAMFTQRTLEFAAFQTILLFITLLGLA